MLFLRCRLGPEQCCALCAACGGSCVSGPEHRRLSPPHCPPRTACRLCVYPQTQHKMFVSQAPPPPPSIRRQTNIAPEIAGISGIFEGSQKTGGEVENKGAFCDILEVR